MKMLNQMLFHQPFGDLLELHLQLEFIHQFHADQIRRLHFYRQAATGSSTMIAQFFAVFSPGSSIVDIYRHGGQLNHERKLRLEKKWLIFTISSR